MSQQFAYTKRELQEMWKRSPERQYNIAVSKILEAITYTNGEITICFSGGKDSALLLDTYCELIQDTPYADKPVKVVFANTTNETANMISYVSWYITYIQEKHKVSIDFQEVKPPNQLTWAGFVLNNGIPLISKMQSKAIRTVKQDMVRTACDYETVLKLSKPDLHCVKELFDIGFSKTGVLSLTGYVYKRKEFGKEFMISRRWLPMINCEIWLTEQCCTKIKEAALNQLSANAMMTGEQAEESRTRENVYLQNGCNARLSNGTYRSKPFGPMTKEGILCAIKHRKIPICADYGEILKEEEKGYYCTKAQRTGCALCGFGCQYDTERFIRLQETEPAKVKFAFKPKMEGGAGFKEAVEYMNEYCGTKVIVPSV